jgi:hypothetical protein
MSFIGQDNSFYAEVTVDGKFNFIDHVTGRIIDHAPIQDVDLSFYEHKDVELQKIIDSESIQIESLKTQVSQAAQIAP